VGLHQCPSEKMGEGVPVRRLYARSRVPSHPQTAAELRGFSLTTLAFTAETDWLLEEARFEPSVPRIIMPVVRWARVSSTVPSPSQSGSASVGSDQHRTARRFEVPHLAALCGGSAARPAEPISQQRMCVVVS